MPRMPRRRPKGRRNARLRPLVLLPILAAGLTGCGSGAVGVAAPNADAAATKICAGIALPEQVQGLKKRTTDPKSPLVAAWGNPAIALRCGVPRPSQLLSRADQAVTLNGVNWLPMESSKPVDFMLLGHQVYVEVTIPLSYTGDHPAGDYLLDLQPAIIKAIPARTDGLL